MQSKNTKLTQARINALEAPVGCGSMMVWDNYLPGFGVRVSESGRKSYYLHFRVRGSRRLIKRVVGAEPVMSLKVARDIAKRWLLQACQGIDPRLDQAKQGGLTVSEYADRYLENHSRPNNKASTVRHIEGLIDRYIKPELGQTAIATLSKADVARLHMKLSGTPGQANGVRALISSMCTVAESWDLRPENSNPTRHVKKYKLRPRKRILTGDELQRIGCALIEYESISPFTAMAIRFLLLSGCRLHEALSLKWKYIDFGNSVVHLPDSKTDFKDVPLGDPATKLLRRVPRMIRNPYVFVGRKPGSHLSNPNNAWRTIKTRAGIEDLTLHDLRRNFVTTATAANVGIRNIGAVVGHSNMSTTEMYSHAVPAAVKAAAYKTSDLVEALLGENTKPLDHIDAPSTDNDHY